MSDVSTFHDATNDSAIRATHGPLYVALHVTDIHVDENAIIWLTPAVAEQLAYDLTTRAIKVRNARDPEQHRCRCQKETH